MLFNSYVFIFAFLPITFFVYFFLNKRRLTELAKAFLVFASLFFYSWWNISYLPLILVSMLVNFALGKQLSTKAPKLQGSRKGVLIFGILFNVGLLGYFKYTDFFLENFNFVFGSQIELLKLALPLAISFFTFQQIAYLVDSYRRETKEYDFLTYALFVSFFPQLIAGPIVHHAEMMPQFARLKGRLINYANILLGLFIFSIGLFKKVIIADTFAIWVKNGFDTSTTLDLIGGWTSSLAYTFQLYFDFSGYCDMAIGAALLFNIKLPINFNSPYKSLDIQDFWRRWHITLGRFLRDYVYIPLGGSKAGGLARTCANLFITFLIGGIWHGAGWTFVIWGALHGIALVIHRIWKSFNLKMPKLLAWFITFNFVNIAWIFFRSTSVDDALKVLKGMFGLGGVDYEAFKQMRSAFKAEALYDGSNTFLYFLVISFIIVLAGKTSSEIIKNKENIYYTLGFCVLFILGVFFMSISKYSEFIYFNF